MAPAKVNLYLDILNKRRDGYHELETIFQTVSWYDTIEVRITDCPDTPVSFQVILSDWMKKVKVDCPSDERNIIWKTAKLFLESFKLRKSFKIILNKDVPIQAGLGGGSSDAAASLKAMAEASFGTIRARQWTVLRRMAVRLGADVPFFLQGGCAQASGIGEKMVPIVPVPKFWAVIVKPAIGLSTKEVYQWFDRERELIPAHREARLTSRSNLHKIKRLIREKKPAKEWSKYLYNSLERVVLKRVKELKGIKKNLMDCGALNAILSGSGSAIFGIVSSRSEGERVRNSFKGFRGEVRIVHSV